MAEITLRGSRVAWREAGMDAAGTPVLFAHCSLAHAGLWKPMMAGLAEDHPCVALDLPAHGRSDPAPAGESLQIFAVEACGLLAERFGRPVHLVGLSLGAATLGRLALRRPDLCATVSLFEPVWFHLLQQGGRDAEVAEEQAAAAAVAARSDPLDAARTFMDRWGVPGGWERMPEAAREEAARIYPLLAADFAWVSGWPAGQIGLPDLAAMRPPAMIVSGETTQAPATAICDLVAAAIPGARRETIAGAGHLSPVSHAPAALALLRDFWASVAPV